MTTAQTPHPVTPTGVSTAGLENLITAHQAELQQPGVLSVRPGYEIADGWTQRHRYVPLREKGADYAMCVDNDDPSLDVDDAWPRSPGPAPRSRTGAATPAVHVPGCQVGQCKVRGCATQWLAP